jgi:hypothetical protein
MGRGVIALFHYCKLTWELKLSVFDKGGCVVARWFLAISILTLTIAGCGGDNVDALYSEAYGSNIKALSNLYCIYQGRHRQVGPRDEGALKKFIAELPADYLKKIDIDPAKIDGLFSSDRDGKPFNVRWGLRFAIPQDPLPIVFESEGVDGVYQVGFSSFIVKEVGQQEYDDLWSKKVKKKSNARGAR